MTVPSTNSVSPKAPIKVTASVRQGTSADFNTNKPRVKRRSVLKMALPVDMPWVGSETTLDFINVEVICSVPVDANEKQIRNALNLIPGTLYNGDGTLSCIGEMLAYGHEPY
jgi:hypothetical protein